MNIATAVGQPDKMQAIVDDVKQQIADAGRGAPGVPGQDGGCA